MTRKCTGKWRKSLWKYICLISRSYVKHCISELRTSFWLEIDFLSVCTVNKQFQMKRSVAKSQGCINNFNSTPTRGNLNQWRNLVQWTLKSRCAFNKKLNNRWAFRFEIHLNDDRYLKRLMPKMHRRTISYFIRRHSFQFCHLASQATNVCETRKSYKDNQQKFNFHSVLMVYNTLHLLSDDDGSRRKVYKNYIFMKYKNNLNCEY